MRLQKFNSRHFKTITDNLGESVQDMLFEARDKFITSEDDTIIVDRFGGVSGHEKVTIEDKGDYVILTHTSITGLRGTKRKNEFVMRSREVKRTSTLIETVETTI